MKNRGATGSSEMGSWRDLSFIEVDRLDELRSIAGPDGDIFLAELRDAFAQDAAERVEILRKAIDNGDTSTLRNVAHTLKGSCTNIGATAMAELCLALENHGREAKIQGTVELVEALAEAYESTTQAFNANSKNTISIEFHLTYQYHVL